MHFGETGNLISMGSGVMDKDDRELLGLVHETIVSMTKALESAPYSFNTAVSDLMKLSNKISAGMNLLLAFVCGNVNYKKR